MMKRIKLFTGFILFGLVMNFFLLSAQDKAEKIIEEKFSVKEGYLLDVSCKFGDVDISAWENNEVKIVAEIWVESKDKAKAEELLKKLDVELSQSGNTVTVKTVVPDNMNNGKDTKFNINLIIQAPSYSNVKLDAKYSNAYLEEISGHAAINLAYSNYKIGTLKRGNVSPLNEINLAYSGGDLGMANWVKMDMAYSKINIEEASNIVLYSKYSDIIMEKCKSFIVDSQYDKFQIEELGSFNGIFKYSGAKLGKVESKFESESAYSNFSIEQMAANFELIKIESRYGGGKINLNKSTSFTIKANASYGSVSVPDLKTTIEKENGTNKYFEGSYGNTPKSKIDINIRHGDVKFSFE